MFETFLENPGQKKLTTVPREVHIKREGAAIVVPENLTYAAAAKALAERAKMEEEPIQCTMSYPCHPNDGYVNLSNLIQEMFGFVIAKATPGFFGPTPPELKRIRTGLDVTDYVEAFSDGVLSIPTLPDISIQVAGDENAMQFFVRIVCKEKHRKAANSFLNELEARIRERSIYRGKAFDSRFDFLDLRTANETKIVLPQDTEKQVRANLFAPLAYRQRLHEIGTPFGRSVLLEGPYGTGKTLLAFIAGRIATDHGITFIYVRSEDAKKLPLYLKYARHYAPAVLFYEDIDLLMGSNDADRTNDINLVLNTLDGIDAKSGAAEEVMLVMTSNDVQSINEALMRPGRIDAVIHVGLPDAYAAAKLIVQYGNSSLARDFDEAAAGIACANMTPAFIREVVERSKLVALSRDPDARHVQVETDDVIVASKEIQDHLKLAAPRTVHHTTGDRLEGVLRELSHDITTKTLEGTARMTESLGREGSFIRAAGGEPPVPLPVASTNGHSTTDSH